MVKTWTHGIDKDSWYRIGTPESHAYERAECHPYAGFFYASKQRLVAGMKQSDGLN